MSFGKKLLRGSLLRNLEFIFLVGVTLVMSPFIIHSLGDRLYGFWSLVGTFVGYYGLLDFGLTSAIGRFVSRGLGRKDFEDVRCVVSTSFFIMLGVGILAVAITLVAVTACPYLITSAHEVKLFQQILFLLGITVAFGFPARVYGGILTSQLRYDYITIVSLARIVLTNVAIYHLLGSGHGLLALTIVNAAGNIVQYLSIFIYCHVSYPQIRVSFKVFDRLKVGSFLEYGTKTFIAQVADVLRFRMDAVLISSFVSLSQVTYFSVGARLVEYFGQFVVSIIGVIGPLFSRYEGAGDYQSIRELFARSTKVSVVLSGYVGISIMFYGEPFIRRWMGPGFESSFQVAVLLAISAMFALAQTPSVNLLYGISKHNFFAAANVAEGVLNLLVSLALVNNYGILGVAFGTTLSMSLFKLFIQPIYTCRCINFPVKNYYIDLLLVNLVKTIFPLCVFFLFAREYMTAEYLSICGTVFVQCALFIPYCYWGIFSCDDKLFFRGTLTERTCSV